MNPIPLLVSLDANYLPQLRVLLPSLWLNHPGQPFSVYLLHRSLTPDQLDTLAQYCQRRNMELHPVLVPEALFAHAPVSKQYPQEMYYRLLAGQLLEDSLDKILYLDPDTLVINDLRPLWETQLGDRIFAAAAHTGKTELANSINQIRLGTHRRYFNSGVLLINLKAARQKIDPEQLFAFTAAHRMELVLPDQDLLNLLYSEQILELDDAIWNYDARNFNNYFLRSGGTQTTDWVMQHTAILHFCGKAKPWKPRYRHRFGILYKHYQQLADRL